MQNKKSGGKKSPPSPAVVTAPKETPETPAKNLSETQAIKNQPEPDLQQLPGPKLSQEPKLPKEMMPDPILQLSQQLRAPEQQHQPPKMPPLPQQAVQDPIRQLSQQLLAPEQQPPNMPQQAAKDPITKLSQQLPNMPRPAAQDPIMMLSQQLMQHAPPPQAAAPGAAVEQANDLMAMLSGLGIVDSHKKREEAPPPPPPASAVPISAAALEEVLLSESAPPPPPASRPTALKAAPPGFQPLGADPINRPVANSFFPHLGGAPSTPPSALGATTAASFFGDNQLGYSSPSLPPQQGLLGTFPAQNSHPLTSLFQSPFPTLDLGSLVQPRK